MVSGSLKSEEPSVSMRKMSHATPVDALGDIGW
jgi:hypothetical protein